MGKRARKRKREQRIDPEELHPALRAGLTQGLNADEAMQELGPAPKVADSRSVVAYLKDTSPVEGSRVPTPRFSADNTSSGFVRESLDRRMADAVLSFHPDTVRAIQSGFICMRCLEPQPFAWADEHLEGCEGVLIHGKHYMKDRQVVDFALEFEGTRHIGPSKPMSELMEEQDLRVEQAKFRAKKLGII